MNMVIKRDGREVPFESYKIVSAITKAFEAIDDEVTEYAYTKAKNTAEYIEGLIEKTGTMSVEEIQDIVEHGLMSTKRKDVAKAYILYREQRSKERARKSELIRAVGKKITASDVQNQNANVDEHSFGGRKGEAADELMSQYALDYCMSEMSRNNHLNNEVYIHDRNSYAVGMHNCITIPFDDLLANGFNTRQVDIRPANSINTAFQLLAVIFQCQSLEQFGGCSASHLDWTMVPYVRKSFAKHHRDGIKYFEGEDHLKDWEYRDFESIESPFYWMWNKNSDSYKAAIYAMDMTKRELKQAVEGMFHNLK